MFIKRAIKKESNKKKMSIGKGEETKHVSGFLFKQLPI